MFGNGAKIGIMSIIIKTVLHEIHQKEQAQQFVLGVVVVGAVLISTCGLRIAISIHRL